MEGGISRAGEDHGNGEEKRMREYTTQMDAARKGILTEEMAAAAKRSRWTRGN